MRTAKRKKPKAVPWPPKIRKAVRDLRAMNLTDRPVRVRICSLPTKLGDCKRFKKYFRIRLSRQALRVCPLYFTKDTIIHEWAHAAAPWKRKGNPHTREWGIVYARIWRLLK